MKNPGFGAWDMDDDPVEGQVGPEPGYEGSTSPATAFEVFALLGERTQDLALARLDERSADLAVMLANGYAPREIAAVKRQRVREVVLACDTAEIRLAEALAAVATHLREGNGDRRQLEHWISLQDLD